MSNMFLTPDEVIKMTGWKQMRAQGIALTHLGIIHKIRADGKPLVLRAHIEQLLGAGIAPKAKAAPHFEPNWAALRKSHMPKTPKKEKK